MTTFCLIRNPQSTPAPVADRGGPGATADTKGEPKVAPTIRKRWQRRPATRGAVTRAAVLSTALAVLVLLVSGRAALAVGLGGSPSGVYQSSINRVQVFTVGQDGALYDKFWNGSSWQWEAQGTPAGHHAHRLAGGGVPVRTGPDDGLRNRAQRPAVRQVLGRFGVGVGGPGRAAGHDRGQLACRCVPVVDQPGHGFRDRRRPPAL